jgi:hypothetical protein
MAIRNELIVQWIDIVSRIKGLQMDPVALADDIVLMAFIFDNEETFLLAMDNVAKAISQLVDGSVDVSRLRRNFTDWNSYHFQSQRTQSHRADLRIEFDKVDDTTIRVKGFGHRHLPSDVYKRLHPR